MNDTIQYIGNSLIQHGKNNDRVYLMKLAEDDYPDILEHVDDFVKTHKYTKVFAKTSHHHLDEFLNDNYKIEAEIPAFYKGEATAFFLGKFFIDNRKTDPNIEKIQEIIDLCKQKEISENVIIPEEYKLFKACPNDAGEMAHLYKQVFQTYPFPIFDPEYIIETMESHIDYFYIRHEGQMIALASTEKDSENNNAEMTDFATLPPYRGKGLATFLLYFMEQQAVKDNIKTAYTIARAVSAGMNITFAKLGYKFAGTLINNTNICGQFESMNVWYKALK